MAMDFSVVGSCSVGRNERWEEGRGGGRSTIAVFQIGKKGLTRSLVTHLEFRDSKDSCFSIDLFHHLRPGIHFILS